MSESAIIQPRNQSPTIAVGAIILSRDQFVGSLEPWSRPFNDRSASTSPGTADFGDHNRLIVFECTLPRNTRIPFNPHN